MGGVNETFSFVSPVFAIYRAHIPQIGPGLPGFGWYPFWICAGLFASIFFLGLASWIVPKSWQDREVLFRKKHFILSDFNSFRSQHLNSNPVSWLVNRNASMRQSRIFLILYIAVAWLAITLYSSLVDRVEPSFIFTGMSLLWLGSLWFRIDLTRHTVSSISEAKESGALEQILVTPIDERQFRRGHFRAMASFWAWPLISLMMAPVLYICIQVLMHPEMLDEGGLIFGITIIGLIFVCLPLLSFFLDIFALYFSGCWFALRNHSFGKAFWKTFGFVYLLPTAGSVFLCFIGPFTGLVTGTIFIVWPLTSLQGNFRRVVSGEYGLPIVRKILSSNSAKT